MRARKAVLADWLQGCYTATSFEEALAQRDQLQPGESIYVKSGHVMLHSVSFYAQDSEQAGFFRPAPRKSKTSKTTARPGADCRRVQCRAGAC